MENQKSSFKQTNAYAMQYGALLGLCGMASLACMVLSFKYPVMSWLSNIFTLGSPFLAGYLTIIFRRNVMIPELGFSFGRGFGYTFLMGIYATLWVALAVFVYLAYIDNGFLFDSYEKMMLQPEVVSALRESGTWDMIQKDFGSVTKLVNTFRAISPAQYAGSIIYLSILVAPFISAIVALVCRKAPNGWIMPKSK